MIDFHRLHSIVCSADDGKLGKLWQTRYRMEGVSMRPVVFRKI